MGIQTKVQLRPLIKKVSWFLHISEQHFEPSQQKLGTFIENKAFTLEMTVFTNIQLIVDTEKRPGLFE